MTFKNKIFILLLATVALVFFFSNREQRAVSFPRETADESRVVKLKDGDSFDLVAEWVEKEIDGVKHAMLAYNGSIPGPLIKVPQGAEITVNFTNNTDIETSLHSHGLRLENQFDGTPPHTQEPIQPGETFTYRLRFPDAGMYWYHPHVREDRTQELGLYGNFLVTPTDENYWSPVHREVPIFLDDILIEDGAITVDPGVVTHALMGRYGNVMLINGSERYELSVQKGEVVRFYLTNAANVRPFNFSIEDTRMKLVGGDMGGYERDEWIESTLLSPSERAIIEVMFPEAGTFELRHTTPGRTYSLGTVTVSDEPVEVSYTDEFEMLLSRETVIKSIDPFREHFSNAPDRTLRLSLDMMMPGHNMPHGNHAMPHGGHHMPHESHQAPHGDHLMHISPNISDGIEWEDDMPAINRVSTPDTVRWKIIDEETGKANMDIDWTFERNAPVKIRIINDEHSMHPMQHPIHFHGQRFLVVSRNDVPQENLVWKDTLLVRAGETVDIVLDPSNPGTWMAHCHIPEHLEADMKFMFTVE